MNWEFSNSGLIYVYGRPIYPNIRLEEVSKTTQLRMTGQTECSP
jgi:hypothetical protein